VQFACCNQFTGQFKLGRLCVIGLANGGVAQGHASSTSQVQRYPIRSPSGNPCAKKVRIIQSIPSPKAEPFKRWLAQVGYERVKEIENPELASARARELYQAKGYPQAWIEKWLRSISVRGQLQQNFISSVSPQKTANPPSNLWQCKQWSFLWRTRHRRPAKSDERRRQC